MSAPRSRAVLSSLALTSLVASAAVATRPSDARLEAREDPRPPVSTASRIAPDLRRIDRDMHPRAAIVAAAADRGDRRDVSAGSFEPATAPYRFAFPRDHAAHPAYQTEWWYYTGHVASASGRRFGYELTFFRVGLHPGDPHPLPGQSRWRGNELVPAHFAITDERGASFYHAERFAREALGLGAASSSRLDVRAEDWRLTGNPLPGAPDRERMTMSASEASPEGRNALRFDQLPEKPPAIHGDAGISKKGPCGSCASHYYSYTRLRTTGTLVYHGEPMRVTGLSWMDHEYGSGELQRDQAGWDWFSIQLDDRRELMLYVLRHKDGTITPESSGSLIGRDGAVRHLPRSAFAISATGSWRSPHTAATYPSGWRVRVPSASVDVTLAPTVEDQEFVAGQGQLSYWEGAVDVRDAARGNALGVGYVELTGYAGSVTL